MTLNSLHHQPQELQVITKSPERMILVENARIRFFMRTQIENKTFTQIKVDTGYIQVSTPENTALDLVRYSKRLGGVSQIATVLMELSEKLTADSILAVAKQEKALACSQRLGYILEKIGKKDLTCQLKAWIKGKKRVPLCWIQVKNIRNLLKIWIGILWSMKR